MTADWLLWVQFGTKISKLSLNNRDKSSFLATSRISKTKAKLRLESWTFLKFLSTHWYRLTKNIQIFRLLLKIWKGSFWNIFYFNRYKRKRPKVDASIFNSALSHTRRSDASEKNRRKYSRPLLDIFACGQVSSPRLYRLTSSVVNIGQILIFCCLFRSVDNIGQLFI